METSMLRKVTAQCWVAVWVLMAAPAYINFETGEFGPRTWFEVAALAYCVLAGAGGFAAILAAEPRYEPLDVLV